MSTEDTRIDEEAIDWLMRHETGAEHPHSEFDIWLERSPKHMASYLRVYSMFRRLDGIDSDHQVNVDALTDNRATNVVYAPFGLVRQEPNETRIDPTRRGYSRLWPVAAAAAVVAVGITLAFSLFSSATSSYETAVGEQRFVKLADGSTVQLNTRSRIQVDFSDGSRHIQLLTGEALFTVAPDPTRPFDVDDGRTTFRALGTQFNLYKRAEGTRLTVTEGVVQVNAPSATSSMEPSPRVSAGEEIDVIPTGQVIKTALSDVAPSVSWPQRSLVFRNTVLPQVVAEFNRYNALQLRLDSERIGARRISGIFGADHPESFLKYLEKDLSIEVVTMGNERVIRDR